MHNLIVHIIECEMVVVVVETKYHNITGDRGGLFFSPHYSCQNICHLSLQI